MPVDNFDNMGIMLRKTPGRGEDEGRAGEQEKEMANGNDRGKKDEDGQEKNKEERTGKRNVTINKLLKLQPY